MSSKLVGTSSSTRTLDRRDLAALRPMPAPKPRAPRKQAEKRVVSSGIVCFCGERFAESQALEFMLHLRAEMGEILRLRESRLEGMRRRRRELRSDPEYREMEGERRQGYPRRDRKAYNRERSRIRKADPEYREKANRREKELRQQRMADPEYRARRLAQQAAWREQNRGRLAEQQRERRAREKAESDHRA